MLATLRICRSPQKQAVIVKLRNPVKVNRVDRHDPALSQSLQAQPQPRLRWAQKLRLGPDLRRLLGSGPHPGCSERFRQPAVRGSPGRDIYFALPRTQDGNGEMRRGSESK